MTDSSENIPDGSEPTPSGETGGGPSRRAAWRWAAALALIAAVACFSLGSIADPVQSRAALVAGACLVLWLTEAVPLFVTTLLLWVGTALILGPLDPAKFSLTQVLSWPAKPVMALFLGGLALSVAGSKHGIDSHITAWIVRISGRRRSMLLLSVMGGTAVLSMWMSNIAAAAMMVGAVQPLLAKAGDAGRFRSALLLGVAFGADFGGMATPIGSGPNLIAISAAAPQLRVTFLHWMLFAVPLTAIMLAMSYAFLATIYRVSGNVDMDSVAPAPLTRRGWGVVVVFCVGVVAWMLEPVHGLPSAAVSLIIAAVLFGSSLLDARDLARLDWPTLFVVAGGLTLGELFETSGLAKAMATSVQWSAAHPTVVLLGFVFACAMLSAVASNTAMAAILIEVGKGINPSPSFAILIAMAASMGVPFVISTPPNAMACGRGGLRAGELLWPGMALMVVGCLIIALTGPWALRFLGVP
ncbi:MAG: SLC13 family permease [Planctomycetota bacterium]|nr:SLC13 family permease [Planctomycetota bacterium]